MSTSSWDDLLDRLLRFRDALARAKLADDGEERAVATVVTVEGVAHEDLGKLTTTASGITTMPFHEGVEAFGVELYELGVEDSLVDTAVGSAICADIGVDLNLQRSQIDGVNLVLERIANPIAGAFKNLDFSRELVVFVGKLVVVGERDACHSEHHCTEN